MSTVGTLEVEIYIIKGQHGVDRVVFRLARRSVVVVNVSEAGAQITWAEPTFVAAVGLNENQIYNVAQDYWNEQQTPV